MSINLDKIKTAISDVSSLEVATLTNANDNKFDLSSASNNDIFTAIRAKLDQSDLVAYTRFELDGDAVNFINKKEEMAALVEEHSLLVDSALETRKTLFNTIYSAVENIIK
ncbi:hypothetical protein GCQ56_08040 [Marinifilum sp. N1E240]|uniref:hypothetical protein n=1 Tax=Marinifilum sp. N1E240 TaxID=2608082 RepID=UPI00128D20C7|nr:hypothetical protein [Marinifilum sp. N1E240]MPQ46965.1 hypothetical protein [Marinifilum sp. N1E240]